MKYLVFGLAFAISGCDFGETSQAPAPPSPSQSELVLRGLPDDALLVGVTIAPNGKRYLLDQRSGLYELNGANATLVWNTTGLTGIELTDVVAVDADHFAVTAANDGFLLDLRSHSLASYFCYLPPIQPQTEEPISVSQVLQEQGIEVQQRTDSVAFNPDSGQLFAQPRTFRLDTAAVAGSELFVFGQTGGQPIQVFPLAEDFVAGGMTVRNGGRLLLGARNAIYEFTAGSFNLLKELDPSVDITGMASANGTLLLLDGAGQRLFTIEGKL